MKKISSVISLLFLVLFLFVISFPFVCFSEMKTVQDESKKEMGVKEFYVNFLKQDIKFIEQETEYLNTLPIEVKPGSSLNDKILKIDEFKKLLTKENNFYMVLINHLREMNSKYEDDKSIDEQINKLESTHNDYQERYISMLDNYKEHFILRSRLNSQDTTKEMLDQSALVSKYLNSSDQDFEKIQPLKAEMDKLIKDIMSLLIKSEQNVPNSRVWEKFSYHYYYNKINLTKLSNIVSVWTYYIVTDDDRKKMVGLVKKHGLEESIKYEHLDHSVTLDKFDCKNRLMKTDESVDYDDEGNVLYQATFKNPEWGNILPESVIDTLYNKICVTPKKPKKNKK